MKLKDATVNIADLTPAMAQSIQLIEAAYLAATEMVITSGHDGVHHDGSKHYLGEAVDVRVKHLSGPAQGALLLAVREALGPDFVAIIEDVGGPNNHLHVQHGHRA